MAPPAEKAEDGLRDQYAKSIGRDEFEAKTLAIIKLARSAMTYLCLGIHAEERRRASTRPKDKIVPPMFLPNVDDQSKR
jgi:hypothetical protein